METSRMKIVYAARERGGAQSPSRIGVAFVGADGALNVKLEALPVSGELRIVDYAPPATRLGAARKHPREEDPAPPSV